MDVNADGYPVWPKLPGVSCRAQLDIDYRSLELAAHARACRQVSAIRWVPMRHFNDEQAGTWWRVYRGKVKLGFVSRRARASSGWQAGHVQPDGDFNERPFATLREAAMFAVGGVT